MDDDLGHLIADLDVPIREIVEDLRSLLAEVIPEAIEEPDPSQGLIGYTYAPGTYKGLIAAIAPHARHVNLMLAKGVELTAVDDGRLLEGTGGKARHIKFHSTADVDRPGVRALITEAARRTPRS